MILDGFDLSRRRLLVAEIGNNHEGSATLALEMVAAAAEAGADVVKVQVINPERLVHRSQAERVAQLSRFRLPLVAFAEMASVARAKGMAFMASAFDEDSLRSVADMVAAVKIASGDLDFEPLLVTAAKLEKPIILSTGMATLDEVQIAVKTIASHVPADSLPQRLALLHCVSTYPTPPADANLFAIQTLRDAFGLTVGYSDHTLGTECSVIALALGARIIEKHFTLDKARTSFRDHALSADPEDLRQLASIVHGIDCMLGTGKKQPSPAEAAVVMAVRRSIVAARDLAAGTRLTLEDLDFVRPRAGLPPSAAGALVGRTVRVSLKRHEPILDSHIA